MSLSRLGLLSLSVALVAGCDSMPWSSKKTAEPAAKAQPAMNDTQKTDANVVTPMGTGVAIARITPAKDAEKMDNDNHVTGLVTFTQEAGKMTITADVMGLVPNSKHGIHIHQNGDLSAADLSSAGGHYDPQATHHHGNPADMSKMAVHAGDLGNLVADSKGVAHLKLVVTDLTIDGKDGIVGHSVIIHAKPDDYVSQPSGNSGSRIAGGIIERASKP
jgi:Cu-Zn family superoxide dismutase